jgi:hypothetical protein
VKAATIGICTLADYSIWLKDRQQYDSVTASLWIQYLGILLGEGYNWNLYACRLFYGYEMPTSFLAPLPGKPVNSIYL